MAMTFFQPKRLLLGIFLTGTCLYLSFAGDAEPPPSDPINLALRHTADGLLRLAGDSISRIPAIEQTSENVWRVRLEQPFLYDALPHLLQSALDRHGINRPYEVAIRRCEDDVIDLGYHQFDWLEDNSVACQGRTFNDECHFIEVTFLAEGAMPLQRAGRQSWIIWLLLGIGIGSGYFLLRSRKTLTDDPASEEIPFGQSRLDVSGQILITGEEKQKLTFRETKLLHLFVRHMDQILERETILQKVWADEGVMVGRSIDVFVSRLRKKLAPDPSVAIIAVHGVGYRLETGKETSSN